MKKVIILLSFSAFPSNIPMKQWGTNLWQHQRIRRPADGARLIGGKAVRLSLKGKNKAARGLPPIEAPELDHYDALVAMRDRLHGLHCAIKGATYTNRSDRAGLLQLMEDVFEQVFDLCHSFAASRGMKTPNRTEE